MRPGIAISGVTHALVLGWGLVLFAVTPVEAPKPQPSTLLALLAIAVGPLPLYGAFLAGGFVAGSLGISFINWVIAYASPEQRPVYSGLFNSVSAVSLLIILDSLNMLMLQQPFQLEIKPIVVNHPTLILMVEVLPDLISGQSNTRLSQVEYSHKVHIQQKVQAMKERTLHLAVLLVIMKA